MPVYGVGGAAPAPQTDRCSNMLPARDPGNRAPHKPELIPQDDFAAYDAETDEIMGYGMKGEGGEISLYVEPEDGGEPELRVRLVPRDQHPSGFSVSVTADPNEAHW